MSLGVLNNLSAIYAENNLNKTNSSLNTVLQQLSSGSRINSGADDAAGLSLINGLQANSMALSQSQTNATEGVGLLTVADGALSQVTNLLNRAVTLATEASNGTLNSSQDAAANQEYQSILSEITNIGATTTYNQQAVFGKTTDVYTGDSSTLGSAITSLNIGSLSSSSVGDSGGVLSYSNGQNNVFINLSSGGSNAQLTDTLNSSGTSTISVNYVAKGASGSMTPATAQISVGTGTSFDNTVGGLINAINGSGLGLSATFATQTQAGVQGGGMQTGIEITGGSISAGSTPGASSTSGTLDLAGLAPGATLATGASVTISQGSQTHTFNIDKSNNTLGTLASAINGQAGLDVNASVITNGDGTQSLSLADKNSTGGALSVTTTAGTTQAPTFGGGTTGTTVNLQTAGATVAGSQYVASSASSIKVGTGGTDGGGTVLTLGTSITIQNTIPNSTQAFTFVVGKGTDVSGANASTIYTANADGAGAASDTLQGMADSINAQNATLGVYATVGTDGLTLTTGSWNAGTGTPTKLTGENVSLTSNNLTAATSSKALALYSPTVGGAAAVAGAATKTVLDTGAASVIGDTVTGSITLTNLNDTYTFTATGGDTWTQVMNGINGSTLGVTAAWNANAGGNGVGGLVLTGNVQGINPVTVSANTLTAGGTGVVKDTGSGLAAPGVDATPATPSTAILQLGTGTITDASDKLGGAVSLSYNSHTQIFIMGNRPTSGSLDVPAAIYTGGTDVNSLVNAINADATLGLLATAPGSGSGGIYLQGAAGTASPITMNAVTAGDETALSVTSKMTKGGDGVTLTGAGSSAVTGQAGNNSVYNVKNAIDTKVDTNDVMTGSIKVTNGGTDNIFVIGDGSNTAVAGTFYTHNTDNGGTNYGNTLGGLAAAITAYSTNHVSAQANTSGLTLTQTGTTGTFTGGDITTSANTLSDVTKGTYSESVTTNKLASSSDGLSGALLFHVGSGSTKAVTMDAVVNAGKAATVDGLISYINDNKATLGVAASWVPDNVNPSFGAIKLTSQTEGASGTVTVDGALTSLTDNTAGASLSYTAGSSYDTGISTSGSNKVFNSTAGQTAASIVADQKEGSGVATISYSHGAGQSLSATSLGTQAQAQDALTAINAAITAVSAQDGYIGAMINTLNSVSSVLATQSQNVTAAQNAVQATDYATAASNMSKYQILSQTGIAALSQANSMQREVTKLLQ